MSSSSTFQKPLRIKGRLRLTTKQVNGGYYKGNNTGSMGFFGPKKGQYIIDYRKVRTYVYPPTMEKCKLTPFVTEQMTPTLSKYTRYNTEADGTLGQDLYKYRRMSGKDFLDEWAQNNETEYNKLCYGQNQDVNEGETAEGGETEAEAEADGQEASNTSEKAEKSRKSETARDGKQQ